MLKILKIAALSLLVSTGLASASTITGAANIGFTYTSAGPLVEGSVLTITPNAITTYGDYIGASFDPTSFDLTASVGSNGGVTFDFPAFDFSITDTTYFDNSGLSFEFGGSGVANGLGFDVSPSAWVVTIAGFAPSGSGSLYILTPDTFVPPVPLPAGLPLLAGGLALFGVLRKRATA